MRLVSYTRTTSWKENGDIPADIIRQQNESIRSYAKIHEWKLMKTYSDRKNDDNEESAFRQMLCDGMNRKFDAVIIHSIDRAGKSLWSAKEVLLQTFHMAGIGFVIVQDDFISVGKPNDEAAQYFENHVNQQHIKKIQLRCGNCRTCMDYSDVGAEEVFFCGHGIGVGKFSRCSKEKYSAKYLEGLVLHAVKKHISVLKECSLLAVDKGKREIAEGKKQIKDKREELDVLKSEKIRHYEAYAEGVINKEVYLKKREEANRRIEDLKAEIEICEDKLDQNRNLIHGADTAAKIAENYETEEKLSVEMVDAFVKNVYVYDIHRIEIVYTFDDKLQLSCKNENI